MRWPGFKERYDWKLLRVTTHRRKNYKVGEKEKEILRFANFVRKLKLKNNYPLEMIINFDECPCWFDMPSKQTIAKRRSKNVGIATCNSDKKRYTAGLMATAAGMRFSCFRYESMSEFDFRKYIFNITIF